MIFEALSLISQEMNEYFRNRLKVSEERVVLSSLMGMDGSLTLKEENKLVITLINLEKQTHAATQPRPLVNSAPTLSLNLDVLISAYFSPRNYGDALKFLSYAIGFFQGKGAFTRASTPALAPGIEKLTFEMHSLTLNETSNLWSFLGAKHAPFVLYRMRMITIDEKMVRAYTPEVTSLSGSPAPLSPSIEKQAL